MTQNIVASLQADIDVCQGVYSGWEGIQAELAGLEVNNLNLADFNKNLDFYSPIFIANNTFLSEHKDTAKAFMGAVERGYMEASASTDEAVAALVKNAEGLDGALVRKSQEFLTPLYYDANGQFGRFDLDRWNASSEWMYTEGLLKKQVNPGVGVTNELLAG
jgi:ABC-type nitrate/sulfonate/bicarbonate transport system substrate-binding protein